MMDSKSLRFITHQSFFTAVRSGDLDALKKLLQRLIQEEPSDGSTVSDLTAVRNDAGETTLYVAAENNLEEVFRHLLRFCDVQTVKIRSKFDMDACHVAAKRGHLAVQNILEVVNAILDADVSSVKIVRKNGKTALHTTSRYGLIRIVKSRIERDPEIVCVKAKKGQAALHLAVKGQCPLEVEEILNVDISMLNEHDKKSNTVVHIAARKGRSQIVGVLRSYTSIDVNAINNHQETAMDLADNLEYGESTFEIKETSGEAGAKHARFVSQLTKQWNSRELSVTLSTRSSRNSYKMKKHINEFLAL